MIRTVLVPLDRSPFAEQALPAAIAIARRAKAELYILHVRTLTPCNSAARFTPTSTGSTAST